MLIKRAMFWCAFAATALGLIHGESRGAEAPGEVKITVDFPGGNALVQQNAAGEVQVAPDLRGDRPWFYWYFAATASKPGRVTFHFPEKVLGGKVDGAIGPQGPAISEDQGATWRWFGTETVVGHTFFYDFKEVGEQVRFAVTIPYVQHNLEAFLTRHAKNKHLQKRQLTTSAKGRPVELLQIGSPASGVKSVLVTARHHATETIASYVLEGFLQAAMSETPAGEAFRKRFVLYAVPFVDKDGVEQGDQGKNRKPHDHNRDYGATSIYPEVQAIRELDKAHNIELSLDFHCPTLVNPDHQAMYFVGPKEHPANNFENVSEFAKWIKQGLPETAPAGPLVWLTAEKEPKPMNSHYFGFKKGTIMAATLETPFAPLGKSMDAESCRSYGEIILHAWVATHFIPSRSE